MEWWSDTLFIVGRRGVPLTCTVYVLSDTVVCVVMLDYDLFVLYIYRFCLTFFTNDYAIMLQLLERFSGAQNKKNAK